MELYDFRISSWGVDTGLNLGFALKTRRVEMTDEAYNRFHGHAKKKVGDFGLHFASKMDQYYHFVEKSWLLRAITVPGDCCGLHLRNPPIEDYDGGLKFVIRPMYFCDSPRYESRNVEHIDQAHCLLSLWGSWVKSARDHLGIEQRLL
ncbi:hypothetical protein ACFLZZ_00180 [Nanoarchaeota archaeon]